MQTSSTEANGREPEDLTERTGAPPIYIVGGEIPKGQVIEEFGAGLDSSSLMSSALVTSLGNCGYSPAAAWHAANIAAKKATVKRVAAIGFHGISWGMNETCLGTLCGGGASGVVLCMRLDSWRFTRLLGVEMPNTLLTDGAPGHVRFS